MKSRPDALHTTENVPGREKHENGTQCSWYRRRKRVRARKTRKQDLEPSVLLKTCTGTQNMKMGADALGSAENESERAKHENGTQRPRYRRKCIWELKT
jgi:hypothetical protein